MNGIRNKPSLLSSLANHQRWRDFGKAIPIAILYFFIARASLAFVVPPEGIATIWPPAGFALAVLLLAAKRSWFTILACIFTANAIANYSGGSSLPVSLGFAFANVAEPLLAAGLLTRFAGKPVTFYRMRDFAGLGLIAAGLSNSLTALMGAAIINLTLGSPFWDIWQVWFVADGVGMLVVAPLTVVLWIKPIALKDFSVSRILEAGLLVALLLATGIIAVYPFSGFVHVLQGRYIVFPILAWAALRFGPRGATISTLIFAALSVFTTLQGLGPFSSTHISVKENILALQIFLGFFSLGGGLLASNKAERQQASEDLRKSEQQYRNLFDQSNDAIFVHDDKGHMLDVNARATELLGYSKEELLALPTLQYHPSEAVNGALSAFQTLQDTGHVRFESQFRRKNGANVDVELSVRPVEDGATIYQAVVRDITERRERERQIRLSEERFRTIWDHSFDGMRLVDEHGTIVMVNAAFCSQVGKTREQLEDHPLSIMYDVLEGPKIQAATVERFRNNTIIPHFEHQLTLWDGRKAWFELSNSVVELGSGTKFLLSIFRDITNRKRAQEELNRFFDLVPDMVCVASPDGHFKKVNKAWEVVLGFSQDELLTTPYTDLIHPDDMQATFKEVERQLAGGSTAHFINRYRRKDGTYRWFEWDASPALDATTLYAAARDITERRKAEDAIRESEARLKKAQQYAHVGSWTWDIKNNHLDWSDEMFRIFGLDKETFSGDLTDVIARAIHPDDRAEVNRSNLSVVNEGRPVPMEYRIIWPDGSIRVVWAEAGELVVDEEGKPSLLSGFVQDITERKRTEELLELLKHSIDIHSDGVYWFDTSNRFIYANDAGCKSLGYSREELLVASLSDVNPRATPEAMERVWDRLRRSGKYTSESLHRRKDGTEFPVEILTTYVQFGGREYNCGFARDITERKRAEEALRSSENTLRAILENSVDAIGLSLTGRHVFANPAYLKLFGFTGNEELTTKSVLDLIAPSERDRIAGYIRMRASGVPPPSSYETKGFRLDGTEFDMDVKVSQVLLDSKVHTLVLLRDITAQKRAAHALKENEEKLRTLFNTLSEGVALNEIVYDEHGEMTDYRILEVNQAFYSVADTISEEIIGNLATKVYGMSPDVIREFWRAHRNRGTVHHTEMISPKSKRWFSISTSPFRNNTFVTSFIDITERKQAEVALQESERQYRQFFEEDLTGDFISTVDGKLLSCNPAFAHIYGYSSVEDALKSNAYAYYRDRQSRDTFLDELRAKRRLEYYEEEGRRVDGKPLYLISNIIGIFDENDRLVRIRGYIFDNTQRKLAEEALRNAQKLEGIGTLAGGIAHDFNNLLNAILGQTSLALGKLAPENSAVSHLLKATKATEHAADLTRQLLAYSGRGKFHIATIDLNRLVNENVQMLGMSVPKTAQLRFELGSPSPHIKGDVGQIQQIIMNLIINSGEALGPNPGYITLRTGIIKLTDHDRGFWKHTGTPLAPGSFALLQVNDTGGGIKPDILDRIFDPFFTTKFTGRGLGLAAVLGIIRAHHGGIQIHSSEGKGAQFEIVFPLATPDPSAGVSQTRRPAINGNGETVLAIDDEPSVLELLKDIFSGANFKVLAASDPKSGIELFRQHHDTIALVILDYSMPQMDGKEAFSELLKINHDARVLLCSGYAGDEIESVFGTVKPAGFIQKPYEPSALLHQVSRVLAARRRET